MAEPAHAPSRRRAIGSSYLLDQSPGAEHLGGLEVVLRPPKSDVGRIDVRNTLWHSEEIRDDIGDYQRRSLDGLRDYAREHDVDLEQFDIELGRFLVHDVDSHPRLYYLAAQHALRSALAAWFHPPLGGS